jgi:hypothetical protein
MKTPNRDENAAARVALALSLRTKKWTYEATARQCGYGSASACRKAVMREMDRVVVENVGDLRREECYMLDKLHALVWEQIVILADSDKGKPGVNLFAVDRILAISERRCKLMGLDVKPEEAEGNKIIIREVPVGWIQMPQVVEEAEL